MIERERLRQMRGWILFFLSRERPRDDGRPRQIGVDLLRRLLANAACDVSIEQVAAELAYLKGKGYVEVERFAAELRAKMPGAPAMGASITSAGRDIVDGTTLDPGVEMGVLGEF